MVTNSKRKKKSVVDPFSRKMTARQTAELLVAAKTFTRKLDLLRAEAKLRNSRKPH